MNLLVDNQLPVALARYPGCSERQHHLAVCKERGMAIVTKDEDFQIFANRQGSTATSCLGSPRQLPQDGIARCIFQNYLFVTGSVGYW